MRPVPHLLCHINRATIPGQTQLSTPLIECRRWNPSDSRDLGDRFPLAIESSHHRFQLQFPLAWRWSAIRESALRPKARRRHTDPQGYCDLSIQPALRPHTAGQRDLMGSLTAHADALVPPEVPLLQAIKQIGRGVYLTVVLDFLIATSLNHRS